MYQCIIIILVILHKIKIIGFFSNESKIDYNDKQIMKKKRDSLKKKNIICYLL